jgi:ornithine carbamoyltransferase
LRVATPEKFHPSVSDQIPDSVVVVRDPREAARDADVLYTDVWVSMGKEDEAAFRMAQFQSYQINHDLLSLSPGALVMHCLPAYRGKEITEEIFEEHAETIFRQAENRLHTQKAILSLLAD